MNNTYGANYTTNQSLPVSILAAGKIVAPEFAGTSDRRAKEDIRDIYRTKRPLNLSINRGRYIFDGEPGFAVTILALSRRRWISLDFTKWSA